MNIYLIILLSNKARLYSFKAIRYYLLSPLKSSSSGAIMSSFKISLNNSIAFNSTSL